MGPMQVLPSVIALLTLASASGTPLRLAFYNGGGTFTGSKVHETDFYAAIDAAATAVSKSINASFTLTNITETTTLHLHNFDVVIFPGGSGTGQSNALGAAGRAAVKAFVQGGGGYIGTCGGTFLAMQHLGLYGEPPPPTVEPWARGHGPVAVEFTAEGRSSLRLPESVYSRAVTIEYWQGPIVASADLAKYSPRVEVLALFRTEIHNEHTNETTGTMVNTPAVTRVRYGKGRVVLNSPHPEIPPETTGGAPGLPPGRTRPEIYAGELAWVINDLKKSGGGS